MNLQLGFGIAGAGVGLLVGMIGGVLFLLPFGIIIVRSLLLAVLLGVVFFALHLVIKKFLPELLAVESDVLHDPAGPRIDISIQDDDTREAGDGVEYGDAERPSMGQVDFSARGFHGDEETAIMEELQDRIPTVIKTDGSPEAAFNEDAFYSGISHLPDIGNFSTQFSSEDTAEVVDSGPPGLSGTASKSGASGNMDPALIAQAIRTALKKEEQ